MATVDFQVLGNHDQKIVIRAECKTADCPQREEILKSAVMLTYEQILLLVGLDPNGFTVCEAFKSLEQGNPFLFGTLCQEVFGPLIGEEVFPVTEIMGEPSPSC